MRTIIASLIAFIFMGLLVDLSAQEPPAIVPGELVRITAPNLAIKNLVGTVVTLNADTVVLKEKDRATQLALPITSLTRLEVSRGRKSESATGAVYGLLLGAGTGYLIGSMGCEVGTCPRPSIVIGSAVGGALIGAGIGSTIKVERWEHVPIEQVRMSLLHYRKLLDEG